MTEWLLVFDVITLIAWIGVQNAAIHRKDQEIGRMWLANERLRAERDEARQAAGTVAEKDAKTIEFGRAVAGRPVSDFDLSVWKSRTAN